MNIRSLGFQDIRRVSDIMEVDITEFRVYLATVVSGGAVLFSPPCRYSRGTYSQTCFHWQSIRYQKLDKDGIEFQLGCNQ